ncbi:MAG: cytochrome ubiquinol oxidase subunit I, partial [Desulfosalsimonas sp.]
LAGWFVTEVGRQPWMVQGLMRTAETASPVSSAQIAVSLAAFILVYAFVFGAGSYYVIHLIRKGPAGGEQAYGGHGLESPPIIADAPGGKGGGYV